jgi:phenylpyruvate tautomerase PptA (4-oxalocrotonate tautomerase family)
MQMNDRSALPDAPETAGVSRRGALMTTGIVAGVLAAAPAALAAAPAALADAESADFGAPVVELQLPAGILSTEQKAEMIKGITDVVLGSLRRSPDPARVMFVQILEVVEGGYGINGQVLVPRPR